MIFPHLLDQIAIYVAVAAVLTGSWAAWSCAGNQVNSQSRSSGYFVFFAMAIATAMMTLVGQIAAGIIDALINNLSRDAGEWAHTPVVLEFVRFGLSGMVVVSVVSGVIRSKGTLWKLADIAARVVQ